MFKYVLKVKDRVLVSMLSRGFLAEYSRVETMREKVAQKLQAAQQICVEQLDELDDHTLHHLSKLPPQAGQLGVLIMTEYARTLCTENDARAIQHMLYTLVPNPTAEQRRAIEGIMEAFIIAQKSQRASIQNQFLAGSHNILIQGPIDNPTFNTPNSADDDRERR